MPTHAEIYEDARYTALFVDNITEEVFDSFHNLRGQAAAAFLHLRVTNIEREIFQMTENGSKVSRLFGDGNYYVEVSREED